ncbi:MAG: DUF402 domain-containing protein [Dehalococcoidia bacterium]|nr:DUF402 domain-containing protein [Dehalococcoidia bacterium]
MDRRRIEEVKIHLDGRRESFDCDLIALDNAGAIVAWTTPVAGERGGFIFPAGAVTTAFFWRGRKHNLYRFAGPDGRLIGHRLDIIEPATISDGRITYVDLILDIVAPVAGEARIEDADELAEVVEAGLIDPRQAAAVIAYARNIEAKVNEVLGEADLWLDRAR